MLRASITSVCCYFSIYRGYTIPSFYILVKNFNLSGKIQHFYSFGKSISFIIALPIIPSISMVTNYWSTARMTVLSDTHKIFKIYYFSFCFICQELWQKAKTTVPKKSQFGRTKVEFTCFPGAHLEGSIIVLTRAFPVSCQGEQAQGQHLPLWHPASARATRWDWAAQAPAEKSFCFCPQAKSFPCAVMLLQSHRFCLLKNKLINPKGNIRVFSLP